MKYTLFAVQVLLDLNRARPLRQQLHAMVRSSGAGATFEEKRAFYEGFSNALSGWSDGFVYGVWDYLEDTSRAETEYETWRKGTVVDALSAAEDAPARDVYRRAAGTTYMFATMLFLLRRGGTADRFVCEECRMPEGAYFRRATLGKLIARVPRINFPSVRADAVFVRPGQDDVGVSEAELKEPHYKYLRKLE